MIQYPEHSPMQLDVDGGYYSRHVDAMTREGLHSKSDIAAQMGARDREIDQLKAALLDLGRARTPPSQWAAKGEPDPHGDRYACDRAALAMGNLTDDEMANAVFMHGNEQPGIADLLAGKAFLPIAYLTAAKDRIRWLSRALVAAQAATGKQQVGESLTDTYVQSVPDKCDRIVWRGHYYHLPIKQVGEVQGDALAALVADWETRYGVTDAYRICAGELKDALAARQPVGEPVQWQQRTRFHNGGTWSDWKPFDSKHGFPTQVGVLEQRHDAEYRPLYTAPPAQPVDPAERSRSEAWSEVYKTLREVCPDLMDHSSVGLQNALHAIRTLAANRTATQPPSGYRWRQPVGTVVGGEFHYLTPKHGLPDGSSLYATQPTPAYTTEMGEAANRYHASFKGAHPLPAQWLWHELWERMYSARVDGVKS